MAAEPGDVAEITTARSAEPELKGGIFWGLLRLAMGWIFLWAFLDKLLALGFATGRDRRPGSSTASAPPPGWRAVRRLRFPPASACTPKSPSRASTRTSPARDGSTGST